MFTYRFINVSLDKASVNQCCVGRVSNFNIVILSYFTFIKLNLYLFFICKNHQMKNKVKDQLHQIRYGDLTSDINYLTPNKMS
jgi:hypothetical protein